MCATLLKAIYFTAMGKLSRVACIGVVCLIAVTRVYSYPWPTSSANDQTLEHRISPPKGYAREVVQTGSFAAWLRNLPLKPGRPPVHLYNGREKGNQQAQYAVVDMDVGDKDLQQCADAVMRLRAEYLFSTKQEIHFHFTSGDECVFDRWAQGYRPDVRGNTVSWKRSASPDDSYASFRQYMNVVFNYAGTASLSRELQSVNVMNMKIGDVFIHGGFPGHAVLVTDMAVNSSGRKVFLIVQSYMPAQEIHVLRNPESEEMGPWYPLDFGDELHTPEWTFANTELKRW